MKKRFTVFLVVTLAAGLFGIDISRFEVAGKEKGANLKLCETNAKGELHVIDDSTGSFNQGLFRVFKKEELKEFAGKYLIVTCQMRLEQVSALDCTGLSLAVRTANNLWVERSDRNRGLQPEGWRKLSVCLFIPPDAIQFNVGINCAQGYGRTAEAVFKDLTLTALPTPVATEASVFAAQLVRFGKKPMNWGWFERGGVEMTPTRKQLIIIPVASGGGTVVIEPSPAKTLQFYEVNEKSFLELDVVGGAAFAVDLVTYGKANRTVRVEASREANRNIRIPLLDFAPAQDLAEFNALEITTSEKLVLNQVAFTGINVPGSTKNLLYDPGFEHRAELKTPYLLVGEYCSEATVRNAALDRSEAFEGVRSVRIDPNGFLSGAAFDRAASGAVFSFYAKAKETAELELMLQPLEIDMHGASAGIVRKKIMVNSGDWKRFFISSPFSAKRPPPQQTNLFRYEIRNSGKSPVYIDALQLEQGRIQPGAFTANRDSNLKVTLTPPVSPERYPGMKITGKNRSGSVPFRVVHTGEKELVNAVAAGGIPFPKGVLYSTDGLSVSGSDGKTIPAQFTVLARRPIDGSIISLKTEIITSLRPGGDHSFVLHYSDRAPEKAPESVGRVLRDGILLDTGVMKWTFEKNGDSIIREMLLRCVTETPDGKRFAASPEVLEIEENGPLSCTILMRGGSVLPYELRVSAYRNHAYLKIDYAFENHASPEKNLSTPFRAIYLELPGGKSWRADGRGGSSDATLIQRHTRTGLAGWNLFEVADGRETVRDGEILSGTAETENGCVRVERLHENAPRGFGFGEEALRVYLWPSQGVDYLDALTGLSGSMRLWYAPKKEALPDAKPPLLQCDAQWLAQSGVFGNLEPAAALRESFPKSWKLTDDVFRLLSREADVKNMYGYGDYGDFGSRNWTTNHETAAVRNLWTRYLRTGDAADFALAEAHTIHQRDIDSCHTSYSAKGVLPHYTWSHINYNFHTGHFWLTGLVYYYLLTGDRRTLNCVIGSACVLMQKSILKYKNGRERHRILFHLAEIYELTGNPEMKKAFERQYNNEHTPDTSGYYGAIAHEAMLKMYEVTGEEKYLADLLREAEAMKKANASPAPMPENRAAEPTLTGAAEEGRESHRLFFEAALSEFRNTSDFMNYLSLGSNSRIWSLLSPNGSDTSLELPLFYLSAMKRFGIAEDPRLPMNYSFLYRLVGSMPFGGKETPFVLELTPDAKGVVALDLFRLRSFRYWAFKRTGDKLTVKLSDSTGKRLAERTLYANVPAEYDRIEVTSPDGRPVRAELVFASECWGGFSSPNAVKVDANRWFSARTSIAVPVAFGLKAPRNGKLRIDWRWEQSKHSRSGEALGIRLESADGKRIAENVFTIPFDYQENETICHYSAELEIPPECRGKNVRVFVSDPKWIEWRISGLDEPWFSSAAL